jgi:hypothetical protein
MDGAKEVISLEQMLRLVSGKSRALRILAVIFAITAILCVSAASVSAAHTHIKEPVDRCDVCYTAHLTAQRVAVIQVVHELQLQRFLAPPERIQHVESRGVIALLTRGPPSSL